MRLRDWGVAPVMPSDGTIGYLVSKLNVLRIECPMYDRQGREQVVRLVAERGPRAQLTDFLSELTADCPQKAERGVTRACGAVMPDLRNLP
jgi:hypothetical protein